MAVQRSFKNMDGIYETDFITVTLWQGLAENLNEYCKKVPNSLTRQTTS